jgi:hypothetical protein
MKNYIILGVVSLFVVLYLAHYIQLTKKNNELRILQTFDPDEETSYHLFKQKLPLILVDEIFLWSLEDEENPDRTIIDKPLSELGPILADKTVHRRIIQNLDHYALALSRGWALSLETIKNDANSSIVPKQEKNYMHLIGCISGEMRIMLFPPNTDSKTVNDPELATKLMDPKQEIACLEIIIRVGNMIYIPVGWWWFPYSHEKTIILDAVNSSLFGIF